jgi:hypothetical protein
LYFSVCAKKTTSSKTLSSIFHNANLNKNLGGTCTLIFYFLKEITYQSVPKTLIAFFKHDAFIFMSFYLKADLEFDRQGIRRGLE